MYNKTIIALGFLWYAKLSMSRKELSASPSARLITLTSTLIILHITKTSSNNCLLFIHWCQMFLHVYIAKKFYTFFDSLASSQEFRIELSFCLTGKILVASWEMSLSLSVVTDTGSTIWKNLIHATWQKMLHVKNFAHTIDKFNSLVAWE